MPTGVEEFAGALVGACASAIVEGAALSPITSQPASAGYADFEAHQSCNPVLDPELQDGSYADPGACVCYDDSQGSSSAPSDVEPAPAPVAGDRPSAAPQPADSHQSQGSHLQKASVPADPAAVLPDLPNPTEPHPLLVIDTRYATITINFNPLALLVPIVAGTPVETETEVHQDAIIEDLFDLHPADDAPDLPGDDARASIAEEHGIGKTVLQGVANAVGAGGVSDALNDLMLKMAEDESNLTDEQVTELVRQQTVASGKLLIQLGKALLQARMARQGGGETAKTPRKNPTVGQIKKKLEIYKAKTGLPAKDVPGVTRTTFKPDKPTGLGRTGPDEVTGIWNENKNIEVKVKSGANNPRNIKSVEVKVREVQDAIPSVKQETATYRRAAREAGLIRAPHDAGHVVQRGVIAFEDPANYWPEGATANRNWKNLRLERNSRTLIQQGKTSMTLRVIQEYSEGTGPEYVTKVTHVVTSNADTKTLMNSTLDMLTGKVIDNGPFVP